MQNNFSTLRLGAIILFCCLTLITKAQQKNEALSNRNVIELSKAGLSNDLIISKINNSSCRFDLSSNGLIELKKQGIKDDVITAMLNKDSDHPAQPQATKGDSYSISSINEVHVLVDGKPKPLEKQVSSIRTKMKALGYGGTSSVLQINGKASPVHLSAATAHKFMIKTDGTSPDVILYRAKVSGDTRQAETMKATMTGLKPVKSVVATNISVLKEHLYEINVDGSLESGEYFFTVKQSSNPSSPETFAFSVD